jgi:Mg2+ and Co2+ transporter CorA
MFRNHYWFTEVTFRPQGMTLYKQFQRGLGSLALYESLSSEVQELQAYYEQKVERQTNTMLNFITIIGLLLGVPGVLTQVYGSELLTPDAWPGFLISLVVGYIIVGIAWLLIQRRAGNK